MKKVRVNLKKSSYDIIICHDKLSELGKILKDIRIGTDAVVITNPLIKKLFAAKVKTSLAARGFSVHIKTVPGDEKAKSQKHCLALLNEISEIDNSARRIFIVALGGGVVGDLAGFVASIYKRGVPYINVPTTLLAQVDSSIGGKVAIDLKAGKNLAGAFYQPSLVFTDTSLLKTLPKKDLISGMAEVIKYGIIKSSGLFEFLEKNRAKVLKGEGSYLNRIVLECASIKKSVVEKDELDNKNIRVILNLGHTVGHAIETAAGYDKSYPHGYAVGLGIISASYISNELGLLEDKVFLKIKLLIKKYGLLTELRGVNPGKILSALEHDKKFIHGKNRFVLPVAIGKVMVREGIPKELVKKSIEILLS